MTGDWRDDALCRGHSLLFEETSTRNQALHICLNHCPVLDACRAWARRADLHGVVAGGLVFVAHGEKQGTPAKATKVHNAFCRVLDKEGEEG